MTTQQDHYEYSFSVEISSSGKAVVSTDDTGVKNTPVSPRGLTVVGAGGSNKFEATTSAPNWLTAFQDVKSFFEVKCDEVSHAGSLSSRVNESASVTTVPLIEQQIRARAAIQEILRDTFYHSDTTVISVPISLMRFLGDFLDIIREETYSKDESQW